MIEQIIETIRNNREIKVVSFDIFDTLLFRTAREPKEVFEAMYFENQSYFPEHTNEEDWVNSRVRAEREAREENFKKMGYREVTLPEIYRKIPSVYMVADKLMELEIECEKKYCFLNQEMYETLNYLHEKGIRIILISDMYLGKKAIADILEYNGFDTSICEEIYVSCDYRISKRFCGLYDIVLQNLNLEKKEIFHIGDNYYSDIGVTNFLGIRSYHYSIISDSLYKHPFLNMENVAYGKSCNEVYAIRLLAAEKWKGNNSEKRFWFTVGAMIAGPFFTYAIEDLLDEAEKNNIQIIRPLMREGKFITELIKNAVAYRQEAFSVEPLYISRFAVFKATFEEITEKEILYLLGTYNMVLRDVFKVLGIEDSLGEFEQFAGIPTNKLRMYNWNGDNLQNCIRDYLSTEHIIKKIREHNSGSSKKVLRYFEQKGLMQKSMTADVGWRGSMQKAINSILKKNGYTPQIIHYLMASKPEASQNALDGCDIRGFVGCLGRDEKNVMALYPHIMEIFFLCEDGTTTGYEDCDNGVVPKTQKIDYPQWQIDAMYEVQEGVKAYQNEFLRIAQKKDHVRKAGYRAVESCHILERLFCYPLKQEVDYLADLVYDQNFGSNTFSPILTRQNIKKIETTTWKNFYCGLNSTDVVWYSGLNSHANPTFYLENFYLINRSYRMLSLLLMTKKAVERAAGKEMVLIGAGANTKNVLFFVSVLGKLDEVVKIVDNDINLYNSNLAGIIIDKVDTLKPKKDVFYFYTTTKKEVFDSVHQQIGNILNDSYEYISFFGEE